MGIKIPQFVWKIVGKIASKKLGLKEGPMTENKKWYRSKGVWTGIVIVVLGLYEGVDANIGPAIGFNLPAIPAFLFTVLGALGIYGRATAKTKITK